MRNTTVCAPAPFGTLNLVHDECDTFDDILALLATRISHTCLENTIATIPRSSHSVERAGDLSIRLDARLLGGKGGFGAQLRSAGGRMKGKKKAGDESNAAMKDASGRKLRTLRQAQQLAEALRDAPARELEARRQKKEKLMAILNTEIPGRGRQVKFDDEDYIAQSEGILEDIRAAMEAVQDSDSDNESSSEQEQSSGSSSKEDLKRAVNSTSQGERKSAAVPAKLAGWDDDDEDLLSSSDEEADDEEPANGKGKEKETGEGPAKRRKTGA